MLELLNHPTTQLFLLMLAATIAPHLFTWLKAKASKTKTMTDDEFVAAIEGVVNNALLRKQKKKLK